MGGMPQRQSDRSELLRITGLFPTKRKGMYTGALRPEDSKKLADLLEQTDRVSVFVFRNDRDRGNGAEFVMYAAPDNRPTSPPTRARSAAERQPIGRGASERSDLRSKRAAEDPEPERDDGLPF